ncbi:glutamate racemase [Allobaculum mucilyticum]|uniref:glutamate racemase n=1 Tax=Allobaculum mucilyticum TaxID=2834459 RepID=UPI001E4AC551|nr:glutamate racemase [Allobaculum mucilyticum]UNT96507.1 glutamate racemase [Allobaculum mucilyticum]
MRTKKSTDPIGVFDSGLGGLTVAVDLAKALPNETILYFGDSARNPYGTRSRQTVENYAMEITRNFEHQHVKAVIIACNTATSAAAPRLRETFDFDIVGMEPALKVAAMLKTPSTIAVWATELTLHEEKFERLKSRFEAGHEIIPVACSDLVRIVEEDRLDDATTADEALKRYLEASKGAEFIVLGCTHFLFFKDHLQQLAGESVQIIDGNEGTIRHLKHLLDKKGLLNEQGPGSLQVDNSDPAKLPLSKKLIHRLEVTHE